MSDYLPQTIWHESEWWIPIAAHDKAVAELKAEVEQWKANAHHHGADAHRLASELVDAQKAVAELRQEIEHLKAQQKNFADMVDSYYSSR